MPAVPSFVAKQWVDSPTPSTPISATALFDLEQRLSGYSAVCATGPTVFVQATEPSAWIDGDVWIQPTG